MGRMLLHWLLSGFAVLIVSQLVPGFLVKDFATAMIAALVIGLANATIGLVIKVVTFPLTLMTLGVFWFVVNAMMIELAANLIVGFQVQSFASAFIGAIVLSLVNMALKLVVKVEEVIL